MEVKIKPAMEKFAGKMFGIVGHSISCVYTLLLLTQWVHAATLNVDLMMSDSSPLYRQFANSFNGAVAESRSDVSVFESQGIRGNNVDLIVAVGMKAAELALAQDEIPVLVSMVPEAGYRELMEQAPQPRTNSAVSVIFLDQPWGRKLDFLRAAIPERRRIGMLFSSDSHIDIEKIRRNIIAHGGTLIAKPVLSPDSLPSLLESVLSDSDALLAIPDSGVYSNNNIRNILLTSYRHGVPLIGISKAYVNAGALCAIFSTPEQLAVQTADAVVSFSRGRHVPAAQYPSAFAIEINLQVARSLGIEIADQDAIRKKLQGSGERER